MNHLSTISSRERALAPANSIFELASSLHLATDLNPCLVKLGCHSEPLAKKKRCGFRPIHRRLVAQTPAFLLAWSKVHKAADGLSLPRGCSSHRFDVDVPSPLVSRW